MATVSRKPYGARARRRLSPGRRRHTLLRLPSRSSRPTSEYDLGRELDLPLCSRLRLERRAGYRAERRAGAAGGRLIEIGMVGELKNSVRNCSPQRSVNLNARKTPRFTSPSLRRMFRPAFPNEPAGAFAKADVLNQRSGVGNVRAGCNGKRSAALPAQDAAILRRDVSPLASEISRTEDRTPLSAKGGRVGAAGFTRRASEALGGRRSLLPAVQQRSYNEGRCPLWEMTAARISSTVGWEM